MTNYSSSKRRKQLTAASRIDKNFSMHRRARQASKNLSETPKSCVQVFVGGLGSRCKQSQLTQFMSQFGYVKEVYISKVGMSDQHKGFAFVNFYRVSRPTELFGLHNLNGNYVEVKRSLQGYLELQSIPLQATETDIGTMFKEAGYKVVKILLGGKAMGIAKGLAAVRLSNQIDHEQAIQTRFWRLLNQAIRLVLHEPRRVADNFQANSNQPNLMPQTENESPRQMETDAKKYRNSIDIVDDVQLVQRDLKHTEKFHYLIQSRTSNFKQNSSLGSRSGAIDDELNFRKQLSPTYHRRGKGVFQQKQNAQEIPFQSDGTEADEKYVNTNRPPNILSVCTDLADTWSESNTKLENYSSEVDSDSTQYREIIIVYYAYPGHL
jgi:RNA recognition motif. (a.k.a. RRM, RBD, or RNP domain)